MACDQEAVLLGDLTRLPRAGMLGRTAVGKTFDAPTPRFWRRRRFPGTRTPLPVAFPEWPRQWAYPGSRPLDRTRSRVLRFQRAPGKAAVASALTRDSGAPLDPTAGHGSSTSCKPSPLEFRFGLDQASAARPGVSPSLGPRAHATIRECRLALRAANARCGGNPFRRRPRFAHQRQIAVLSRERLTALPLYRPIALDLKVRTQSSSNELPIE